MRIKVSIVKRVRIGFTISIFALAVVVELVTTTSFDIYRLSGQIFCASFGIAGLLLYVTGCFRKTNAANEATNQEMGLPQPATNQDSDSGQPAGEHPLAPFTSAKYWGMILVVSGATVACASAYRYKPLAPKPSPPKSKPVLIVAAPSNPPVVFPPLELESVILNGSRSTAMINRRVLRLGESIGDVQVVAIDDGHATVELKGATNVISLRR